MELFATQLLTTVMVLAKLAMRLRGCKEIIGECGLKFLEDTGDVEIGWMLMPAYWGRGLATEAARATLHHAFTSLQFDEIVAVADERNHASLRIIDKLGMQFVGYARHYGSLLRKYSIARSRSFDRLVLRQAHPSAGSG